MNPNPPTEYLNRGGQRGRPKGSRNKRTLEIQAAARNLVENSAYQKSLKKRLIEGKAPHMEPILFYYAYGKPIDRVEIVKPMILEIRRLAEALGMTPEEVVAEAEAIANGREG